MGDNKCRMRAIEPIEVDLQIRYLELSEISTVLTHKPDDGVARKQE